MVAFDVVTASSQSSSSSFPLLRAPLLLLLLLLAAAAPSGALSCLGEKKVLSLKQLRLQLGNVKAPEKCLPQRSRRVNGATILEMKHQSYCSGSIEHRDQDKIWRLLDVDDVRASSLQSRLRSNSASLNGAEKTSSPSEANVPLSSGAKLQILNYIVIIELGGKRMTVIVDTGSDLTWVQCMPCKSCYSQEDPLFNPAASPSYQPIPCNSSTCDSLLQTATGVSGVCRADSPSCEYALSYGDGSSTNGVLATDEIDLAGVSVQGFVFGCGQSNQGMFGGTSGLMGLGRSQLSLVSQTTPQFGGVFSYCLPTREFDSSGSLILGDDSSAYKNLTPISYSRMISDPQSFYFLNLTGMSVGGRALGKLESSRVLIDSGTVITRLPPSVYGAMREEFLRQFSGYPAAPGFSILDTCFDLAGYEEVSIPTIRFRFEGEAEVDVDASGVLYFVKPDASQVCLAFASLEFADEAGIIGNYQQKNLRVVYDTVRSRLGFAEETCGYI